MNSWDQANGLLSEGERRLLEVATELMATDELLVLSGSLMLAVAGVNRRREAVDIDFVYNDFAANFKKPKEAIEGDIDSGGGGCSFKYNGVKVDILSSGECPTEISGIRCASYRSLLKNKYKYSKQDYSSAEKHRLDLIHLGVYQQFVDDDLKRMDDSMPF